MCSFRARWRPRPGSRCILYKNACMKLRKCIAVDWQCLIYKATTAMAIMARKPMPAPTREAPAVGIAEVVAVVAGKPAEGDVVKVVIAEPVG